MVTVKAQAEEPRSFLKGVALFAVVFGTITVMSGGSVLFGPGAVQDAAGSFVPFVVWFNFIAGFAYIAAGVAIWRAHRWDLGLSVAIAVATFLAALGFGAWVLLGHGYEMRTVGALALRFVIWVAIVLAVQRARRRP